jgi:hypothetical protein
MNATNAASAIADRLDEQDPDELPDPAGSALRRVQPYVSDDGRTAMLAAVTAVVSLLRAARTLRRGDRKRGLLQALGALFWVGLALAQRPMPSTVDQTDVADTAPDIEGVETDDPDGEHATGATVVDTTDAAIDESNTAPEVDGDAPDVDQRDVVDTDEVESVADHDEAERSETGSERDAADSDEAAGDGGNETTE